MTESDPPHIEAPNDDLKPHITDWLRLIFIPVCIPIILVQVLFRRTRNFSKNEVTLLSDLGLSAFRFLFSHPQILPLSLIRSFSSESSKVLTSPRFRNQKSNIYQPVLLPKVAGYWLCKGAPGCPTEPLKCDIVLYYLHGGAYSEGHPARFLPLILRVAEIAAERGITLSCFALKYSYAPEKKYPTQLNQAIEGYKYLLDEERISAKKIGVLGDSAGGHLALCLLTSLPGLGLPKPERGVFLMSPWLDLQCTIRPSVVRNKYTDTIPRDAVFRLAKELFSSPEAFETCPHLDFTAPLLGTLKWRDVLPKRVWMSAGGNEVLLDEIVEFKGILEKEGVVVDMEVKVGGIHVWQGIEDIGDAGMFLKTETKILPEGMLMGCRNVADAVLKDLKT
ncbi:Alpha/Beta hydrolase protein [Rhexocercosporidium sp. MPI-PUGE-AT-0058]|nr:Alpha/Beta hydrolase protein [Rhexocercosporidium sp. MPI-PUGE-AT-0058]